MEALKTTRTPPPSQTSAPLAQMERLSVEHHGSDGGPKHHTSQPSRDGEADFEGVTPTRHGTLRRVGANTHEGRWAGHGYRDMNPRDEGVAGVGQHEAA